MADPAQDQSALGRLPLDGRFAQRSDRERTLLAAVATRAAALDRHRDGLLGAEVGDCGWELLLAIYARGGGVRPVPVRELVATSRHHAGTTLRTAVYLEQTGKIVASSADDDPATRVLALTPATAAALETFLEDIEEA